MSEEQGYFLNPEHPANKGKPDIHQQRIAASAAHRESLLPSSRSAGQPLAPAEVPAPRTEVERLVRDPEQWAAMQELRRAAGL